MKKILLVFAMFASFQYASAQNARTVHGTITNENGEPVFGAEVRMKNGQMATFTDENGNYSLELPEGTHVLIVDFVGLGSKEIVLKDGQDEGSLVLSKSEVIDDIVIQGVKIDRRTYTGSLTTITSKQIEKRPVTNIARAMEGAAPGVMVTSGGGQPGASPDILIRGAGSLAANNAPLIVLDGAAYGGTLASINPLDVAEMTFLKDANATALYGSRGANGVIVINTKRGARTGKPQILLDASVGVLNRFLPEYERLGAKDYLLTSWDAYASFPNSSKNSTEFFEFLGGYNPTNLPNDQVMIKDADGKFILNPNAEFLYVDDWQEELQRTGIRQQYNLSVSNGNDKSDYFLSIGYANDEGIVKNSKYDRFSTRLNTNTNINSWLKAGLNLSATLDDQQFFVTTNNAYVNPFFTTRMMGPIYPVYRYDKDGNRMYEKDGVTPIYDFGNNDANNPGGTPQQRPFANNTNVIAAMFQDERHLKSLQTSGSAYLEAKFLKDFTLNGSFNTTFSNFIRDNYQNMKYGDASNVKGRMNRDFMTNYNYTFSQNLNWNPSFGIFSDPEKHRLNVVLVHEAYAENYRSANITRTGFVTEAAREGSQSAVGEGSTSYEDNFALESYIASVKYDFNNKYFINANVNRNGTSRFSPKSRWGTFYSIGGGWIISEENFMESSKSWLDNLRIRGSYGYSGQQDLGGGYYVYRSKYSPLHNDLYAGLIFSTLSANDLNWEKRLQMNIGFDIAVFKNRLSLSMDYFNNGSREMLYPFPIAPSRGISSTPVNIGDMNNKGIEMALTAEIVRPKKPTGFGWTVRINGMHLKNEIIKVQNEDTVIGAGTALIKGYSRSTFYLPRYAGVNEFGQALYYMKDGSTTIDYTSLTTEDYAYAGTSDRDFEGSFTSELTYKNFDLTFMLSIGLGGKFYDNTYVNLMSQGNSALGQAWHVDMLNAWKEGDGEILDINAIPRASYVDQYSTSLSDRFLISNSFLNLKQINFGYTFTNKLLSRASMTNARVYISLDNVAYLAGRKGVDLGQSFFGASSFNYYPYRTLMFGIQVGL